MDISCFRASVMLAVWSSTWNDIVCGSTPRAWISYFDLASTFSSLLCPLLSLQPWISLSFIQNGSVIRDNQFLSSLFDFPFYLSTYPCLPYNFVPERNHSLTVMILWHLNFWGCTDHTSVIIVKSFNRSELGFSNWTLYTKNMPIGLQKTGGQIKKKKAMIISISFLSMGQGNQTSSSSLFCLGF